MREATKKGQFLQRGRVMFIARLLYIRHKNFIKINACVQNTSPQIQWTV